MKDLKVSYSPDLLNKLVLRQRSLEELDLVALFRQDVSARLVYILQQKDLDVGCLKRLQLLALLLC